MKPSTTSEYVELTGNIPYHLRRDASGAECPGCGRRSWCSEEWDGTCDMPQPNGSRCQGSIGWPEDVPRPSKVTTGAAGASSATREDEAK